MKTYPIMLDLRGKLAVVIGAGPVGLRKVEGLRRAEARVRLIDRREPAGPLPDDVDLRVAPYEPEMLAGAAVVFACTDQPAMNSRIAADARAGGALVNVADVPDECDFYAAAVIQDDDVILAIGTGGASPGLAGWLRKRLAPHVPDRIGEFAAALQALRGFVREALPNESHARMKVMKHLVSDDTYREFLAGGPAAVRAKLRGLLESPED